MRNYLYVFIGGAAGGLLRVMVTRAENLFTLGGMDLTIFLINLTGAFLLGLFLSGVARFESFSPGLHLGISVGFFGSFTTFSTFCMEAAGLLQTGKLSGFILYIVIACLAGLLAAELGFRLGNGTGMIRAGKPQRMMPVVGLQKNFVTAPILEEEAED